jgi:hypothetical protein
MGCCSTQLDQLKDTVVRGESGVEKSEIKLVLTDEKIPEIKLILTDEKNGEEDEKIPEIKLILTDEKNGEEDEKIQKLVSINNEYNGFYII